MAETVAQKETCAKCGAEVREGTTFCYACGGRVAPDAAQETNGSSNGIDANAQAALDDLAQKLRRDETAEKPADDKLAKAAEERKKARVTQRRSLEFVWEPRNDTPITLLISAGVVLVVAVLVIVVTVIWK
ncbi:MAG: zinc ribbon domain-containing protein [Acidobacteria bacterium]|nr:zinc ribbon domain-containing protein [Acidobacteriota bacterium]